jgi:protein O-GlcNAc transferase
MTVSSPFQDPRFVKALGDLEQALLLQRQGRVRDADKAFARLIKHNPDYFDGLHLYGLFKHHQGQHADALKLVDRATRVNPRSANAFNTLGVILSKLARHDRALASFDAALALEPGHVVALANRCNTLNEFGRFDETIATADRAITLDPRYPKAFVPRGAALLAGRRHREALESYDQAIARDPNLAIAWVGRGDSLMRLRRFREALASYDRAMALEAEHATLPGSRLHAKLQICEWSNYDADVSRLLADVRGGALASPPFFLLAMPSSPADQFKVARLRSASGVPPAPTIRHGGAGAHDRIRIAYLSSDLREHPVGYLMAGVFEHHDRSRFDVTAVSYGPDDGSPMRHRIETACDRFIDANGKGDPEVCNIIRSLGIDVTIDLNGLTAEARTNILALRAAPVQVNYLGYPGTMGASFIDYIIGDAVVTPAGCESNYAEKIVRLPDCYMPGDAKRKISDRTPTRADAGLPEQGFVFCSFNQTYKFTPTVFDVWMRLLRGIDGSVLWLSSGNDVARDNLRREAQARGIDGSRIVFATRVPLNEDHLARLSVADLFIDTLPFNAHSTASDSLWAGLPVLTCMGDTFAGRAAASLLTAIGLPELITTSLVDYEALALTLAREPQRLADLRIRLAANRASRPLFDTARFTRHMESAYITMVDCCRRGAAPRSFSVPSIENEPAPGERTHFS